MFVMGFGIVHLVFFSCAFVLHTLSHCTQGVHLTARAILSGVEFIPRCVFHFGIYAWIWLQMRDLWGAVGLAREVLVIFAFGGSSSQKIGMFKWRLMFVQNHCCYFFFFFFLDEVTT